jgi:uncharacterized protein
MTKNWEEKIRTAVFESYQGQEFDPAHDFAHFVRVVHAAKAIGQLEGAEMAVVVPAAWMHDWVNVLKHDPRRTIASRLSAEAAVKILSDWNYPEQYLEGIAHAIEAHSYSAGIVPRTIEAKVVQDADRLDALGAIGIARVFSTAQRLGASYYHPVEPLAETRVLDDKAFALDHFFIKLFPLAETFQTKAGRVEGLKRRDFMNNFVTQLMAEFRP